MTSRRAALFFSDCTNISASVWWLHLQTTWLNRQSEFVFIPFYLPLPALLRPQQTFHVKVCFPTDLTLKQELFCWLVRQQPETLVNSSSVAEQDGERWRGSLWLFYHIQKTLFRCMTRNMKQNTFLLSNSRRGILIIQRRSESESNQTLESSLKMCLRCL